MAAPNKMTAPPHLALVDVDDFEKRLRESCNNEMFGSKVIVASGVATAGVLAMALFKSPSPLLAASAAGVMLTTKVEKECVYSGLQAMFKAKKNAYIPSR